MTVLLILLAIVIVMLAYLFFAPFYLEVDTAKGLYGVRFHRLARASLNIQNDTLMFEIRIAGWKKQIDLFAPKYVSKAKSSEKRKKKKKGKIPWKKIKGVLESFKINKCTISVDSGDRQLNGILYPVFYFASIYTGKNIRINFVEENEIILEIKNSLARMSWAYVSS